MLIYQNFKIYIYESTFEVSFWNINKLNQSFGSSDKRVYAKDDIRRILSLIFDRNNIWSVHVSS